MKKPLLIASVALALVAVGAWYLSGGYGVSSGATPGESSADAGRVRVVFSDGHATDPRDGGRPVVLIAAALGVEPEVFRAAFSGVQPAKGPFGPSRAHARRNKEVLMAALGPHGVTNDRLDEVSNYYRYRPQAGELWPVEEAVAYAIVEDGAVVRFEIERGGSGYSSPPTVTVPGHPAARADVQLSFGPDFARNGEVSAINAAKR